MAKSTPALRFAGPGPSPLNVEITDAGIVVRDPNLTDAAAHLLAMAVSAVLHDVGTGKEIAGLIHDAGPVTAYAQLQRAGVQPLRWQRVSAA